MRFRDGLSEPGIGHHLPSGMNDKTQSVRVNLDNVLGQQIEVLHGGLVAAGEKIFFCSPIATRRVFTSLRSWRAAAFTSRRWW